MLIYKILTQQQWRKFSEDGVFHGATVDLEDGYIHLSSPTQVRATAQKHFAGLTDLWLLAIDEETVKADLKWEISRGGALFPHLYGILHKKDIASAKPLPFFYGRHMFDADIPQ